MTKNRKLAYVALILTAIIWGAALPIVKPALEYMSAYHYLFIRYLMAAILSLPVLVVCFWKYKPTLKDLATIGWMEFVVLGFGHYLLYEGLSRTSALEASILATTSPIIVTLGGIIFLKEKEERHEWWGLALALIGTLIIILEPIFREGNSLKFSSLIGNMMVMGYNLIWAFFILKAKSVYKKIPKLLVGFVSPWIGLSFYWLLLAFKNPILMQSGQVLDAMAIPSVLTAVMYMGTLGSVVAIPLVMYGNNQIEASEAALFSYLQPLVYIPLSIFWLKEAFSPILWLALPLIAVGVYMAERRPRVR